MALDAGRKFDLEELAESVENAKTSGEREYYKKIIHRILSESDELRYWRENLIKAMRASDKNAIHKINLRVQDIRLRETNGKSWGNNNSNRDLLN